MCVSDVRQSAPGRPAPSSGRPPPPTVNWVTAPARVKQHPCRLPRGLSSAALPSRWSLRRLLLTWACQSLFSKCGGLGFLPELNNQRFSSPAPRPRPRKRPRPAVPGAGVAGQALDGCRGLRSRRGHDAFGGAPLLLRRQGSDLRSQTAREEEPDRRACLPAECHLRPRGHGARGLRPSAVHRRRHLPALSVAAGGARRRQAALRQRASSPAPLQWRARSTSFHSSLPSSISACMHCTSSMHSQDTSSSSAASAMPSNTL